MKIRFLNTRPYAAYLFATFVGGTATYGVGKLVSFFLKIFLARNGVSLLGGYYLATEMIKNISLIGAFGIPMSTSRFIGHHKQTSLNSAMIIQSAILLIVTITVMVFILLQLLFPQYFNQLDFPITIPIHLLLLSASIGIVLLQLAKSIAFGFRASRMAYIYESLDLLTKGLFTLIGFILTNSLTGAISGYAIAALSSGIIALFHSTWSHHIPLRIHFSTTLLHFAVPVGISEIITASSTLVLLSLLSKPGTEAVGIFASAMTLGSLVFFVPQLVLPATLPVFAEQLHDPKKGMLSFLKTFLFIAVPTVCISIGMIITIPITYPFLFGSQYEMGEKVAVILITAHTIYALGVWMQRQMLDAAGKTSINLGITILRAGTLIFVASQLIPGLSAVGAGWAILIAWSVEAIAASLCFVVLLKR